jgi:thymidylate synthase (FAD)
LVERLSWEQEVARSSRAFQTISLEEPATNVQLVGRPVLSLSSIATYLESAGYGDDVLERWEDLDGQYDADSLVEFMGRLCYDSFAPGHNLNVTKIRDDQSAYIKNIIQSGHGSVLEHCTFSFVFSGVSRILTHELVRHRVGTAISQESMRYKRIDDEAQIRAVLMDNTAAFLEAAGEDGRLIIDFLDSLHVWSESTLRDNASRFNELMARMDKLSFYWKKQLTSAFRAYVPDGILTTIGWSANIRTLRHVIAMRTAEGSEVEIRQLFDQVAAIMKDEAPLCFADFERDVYGVWRPGVWDSV